MLGNLTRAATVAIACVASPQLQSAANAQEFADTQTIANRALFAAQDVTVARRAAEIRRVEALNQRAERQAEILQVQALTVAKLGTELQTLKDERRVTQIAADFDAMVAAGQLSAARSFLADTITTNLVGAPGSVSEIVSADVFMSSLPRPSRSTNTNLRSRQQVRFEIDRAFIIFEAHPLASGERLARDASGSKPRLEYRLVRDGNDWKIDGLSAIN